MRLPWGVTPTHVAAGALGLALLVMPIVILSYDPESRLDRLRSPLCSPTLVVEATNQNGGSSLLRPDSGVKARATRDGEPVATRMTLFVREPGAEWRIDWALDAPAAGEIFYLPKVAAGMEAFVRAVDPTGGACPGESRVLTAPPS